MSTSPSTPSTAATGHTATAHTQGASQQRRGASASASGGDLFANLLTLLNAGGETPLLTTPADPAGDVAPQPGTARAAAETAEPRGENPLAALLAWTMAPLPPRNPTPTGSDASATATAPGGPSPHSSVTTTAAETPGTGVSAAQQPVAFHAPGVLTTPGQASPMLPNLEQGALPTAEQSGSPSPATRGTPDAPAAPATRITAWRSTTTLAHAAGATMAAAAHAAGPRHAGHFPMTGHAAEPAAVAQAAATSAGAADAAAGDRPDATPGPATDRTAPAGVATSAPGIGGDGTSNMGGGSADDGAPAHHDTSGPTQDATTPDAAATAFADEADPLAGWTSPHVRHASVRVGDAGEAPIDIQLSLDGQAVQVSFQTEDIQTRDSLAREAGAALGELLQRSGMELGGVSVGGQGASAQQQAGGQPTLPQGERPGTAPRSQGDARTAAEPPRAAPRRDDGRPLDLFV